MSTATLHNKKKKTLVPTLRFPEFNENWETLILGDLLTFKNGLNSEKEMYGKGIKFINVLDILNNNFITYNKIIGSVEVTEKEFEKNEVSYGDILFQRSSETREEVGQANVYLDKNKNCVFGGFVIRGKAKSEYKPLFMNYLLRTPLVRKEITDKSGGSTRYNVGQDTLSKVKITTTSLPEQQKIASFLSAVDEKIQQLSRKKELLEEYKKGVMQQLFSGKLRFKDENGEEYPDWEEKKLGDVGNVITGKTPSTTDSSLWNGDIQFITPTDIKDGVKYQKSTDRYVTNNDKIKVLPSNSIIYTCIASIGKMCISKFPCITNQQINSLVVHENYNFEYVYYWLFHITPYIKTTQANTTLPIINKTDFSKFSIKIPSFSEQQKIANFLSSIDIKIENTNQQINQIQNFKKGLLQQMFV